jgi:hypothetical protein
MEKTVCVSDQGMNSVEDLYSSHEEADTRTIFHAMQADADFFSGGVQGRITIKSPDTDVIVLAVHYFPHMKNTHTFWIETGSVTATFNRHRFIPVHELFKLSIVIYCAHAVGASRVAAISVVHGLIWAVQQNVFARLLTPVEMQ